MANNIIGLFGRKKKAATPAAAPAEKKGPIVTPLANRNVPDAVRRRITRPSAGDLTNTSTKLGG